MADKDDAKNLTIGPQPRKSGALAAGVTQQLAAIGVPAEKHDAKIDNAKEWWGRACLGAIITLIFLAGAGYILYLQRAAFNLVLAIGLAVLVGLPALFTLFCASQADGEATKAFLATVAGFLPFTKKAS